ncbi:MAG TPA: glycosyltransferase [Prolixibacteraceae bacterium]|nr:glycosyltransferase [Prolixibacteraceae bacterium]
MKRKILLIVPINHGTIGLVSFNLYQALLNTPGIDVKVALVYEKTGGNISFGNSIVFSQKRLSGLNEQILIFRKVSWLRKIKKNYSPDITISTLFGCSTLNVLAKGSEVKIGIFHSPHQQTKLKGFLAYCLTYLNYKFVYPHLDKLFCVSHEVYNSIIDSFPQISLSKLDVVYNVHDIEKIKTLALEELNADENKIFKGNVILYCGRLDKNKAPDRLVRAFGERYKQFPPNSHIVFLGNDTDKMWNDLVKIATKFGIGDRIHFLKSQSNPYKFMARSKVLVSSSYSEGLPGVLIESILLGTPVVTTNSSKGVWEILSCENDYSSNLENIFCADNGVISSNLSDKDPTKYGQDIANMSHALEYIFAHDLSHNHFFFKDKITPVNVVKKYLLK